MLSVSAIFVVSGLAVATPTPLRLTADVEDVYALDANPAGLGYLNGGELRLLYARDDLDSAPVDGFGAYAAGRFGDALSMGMALDIDVDDQDRTGFRFTFGQALRVRALSVGWSVARVRPPGGEGKTRLSAGLTYRWTSWLSSAVAVRDLAQTADRRRWDLGLAVRPWERLLLSTRWRLTQSQGLSADTLDLAGLLSVEPLDGLTVGVGVERSAQRDLAVTAQVELNFGRFAVGAAGLAVNERPGILTEVVLRSRERPGILSPSSIAVVDLAGDLSPEPTVDLFPPNVTVPPYGDLPLLLETLATSDRVYGVFARIGPISAGWAKAEEVRAGLLAIRAAGRRVDCQLSGSADVSYFVATACDSIIMPPPGMLRVDGVASTALFFGDLLDGIGLKPEVVRRGRYKSAPEQLTRAGMSPDQRESLGAYLDEVYGTLVTGIAKGRSLSDARVRELLDLATHTASQALARGLVDHVLYPDEVEDHLQKAYGRRLAFVPADRAAAPQRPRWGPRPRIAVLYVDAAITGGDSQDLPFGLGRTVGARTLVLALEALRTDPGVRAVVLRIDSPGGDSLASDLIARAVGRLAEVKPVVASMGDVAASGGYYVAAPARTIYAEPTTLTGSIGVFTIGLSASRLLGRVGIGVDQIERGALSGGGTPYRDWRPEERARVEEVVDHYYQQFLQVVADGRDMEVGAVRKVAEGRIWSGRDAKAQGLVDELGGLVDALRRAKLEAGFAADDEVEVEVHPSNRRPLPEPVRTLAEAFAPSPSAGLGLFQGLVPAPLVALIGPILASGSPDTTLALMPFALRVR